MAKVICDYCGKYAELPNKVFVVFFINFNNEERYSGVYSSKEKAEAYIARFAEPKSCFTIEEVIVDSE